MSFHGSRQDFRCVFSPKSQNNTMSQNLTAVETRTGRWVGGLKLSSNIDTIISFQSLHVVSDGIPNTTFVVSRSSQVQHIRSSEVQHVQKNCMKIILFCESIEIAARRVVRIFLVSYFISNAVILVCYSLQNMDASKPFYTTWIRITFSEHGYSEISAWGSN